jgi:hypothetical protein
MVPLDLTMLFAGGESFDAAAIGLPPGFPVRTIFTENITPHSTGVQGWTAAAIAKVIKDGIDKDGVPICPPMPAGPGRAFNGITDSDALDIGQYITHLPPIDNTIPLICHEVINGDGGPPRDGSPGDVVVPPEGGNDAAPPDAPLDVATPPDSPGDTGGGGPDGTGDGTTGDGTTGDGATGDGATGDGATGDGATGDGTTGGDAASDSTPD